MTPEGTACPRCGSKDRPCWCARLVMTPEGTADGPDVALTEDESAHLQRLLDDFADDVLAEPDRALEDIVVRILADRLAAVTEQRDQYAAQVASAENEGVRLAARLVRDHMLDPKAGKAVYNFLIRRADRAALRADGGGGG